MDELELAIRKRNARFRAAAALRLPLEGEWQLRSKLGPSGVGDEVDALLRVSCQVCQMQHTGNVPWRPATMVSGYLYRMALAEAEAIRWLSYNSSCGHLLPLIEGDSPELLALADLELIAHG